MIDIRPSSASPSNASPSNDAPIPPEVAATPEEPQKRIPLVWIPVTLGVGLLIAAIYLGGRIVTGHTAPKPAVVQVTAPIAAQPLAKSEVSEVNQAAAPPAEQKPVAVEPLVEPLKAEPLTVVTPDDGIPMIAPQSGELFIQVGALDQEATRHFIQRLRSQGLEPHVAPGPKPELMRVLIGPFDNREALNEKKAQFDAERIDNFVRRY
jgi:cell division septation protein DedD